MAFYFDPNNNCAIAEFGTGDIFIRVGNNCPSILLTIGECGEIGRVPKDDGKDQIAEEPKMELFFNNIQSIDVMIKMFKSLKRKNSWDSNGDWKEDEPVK